jgi:hypothetical protein
MSGYAQMMKKKGAMTKKGKETPAQNLERETRYSYCWYCCDFCCST